MGRLMTHATENYEALDCFLKAAELWQRFEKESNAQAQELLIKAIDLDPEYGLATAFLGYVHLTNARQGWGDNPSRFVRHAEELARRALEIDDTLFMAHQLLGGVYQDRGLYEQAIIAKKKAVDCEPNNFVAINSLASTLIFADRSEEALVLIRKAMRLCPYPPPYLLRNAGFANYLTGRYEQAATFFKQRLERFPPASGAHWAVLWLIASYIELGKESEASAEVQKLLNQQPGFSTETHIKRTKAAFPFKNYAFLNRQTELLHKAGLR